MTRLAWLIRGAAAVLLCVILSGCGPAAQSDLEEEREPHFLQGKSCVASLDYKTAIEKFEQTLEVNPHHAKAHFELGCLFEEKEPDPAAAIYHFEQFLKLRPAYENAEVIRQHINNCKLDLAKTVLLPIAPAPGMQRQFEQLADENKRLRDEVEQWKTFAQRQPSTDSSVPTPPPLTRQLAAPLTPVDSNAPGATGGTRSTPTTARTYTVQSGDSPYSIARKYGVKLEALMAANPGLEPRRMRVGQTLNIPTP